MYITHGWCHCRLLLEHKQASAKVQQVHGPATAESRDSLFEKDVWSCRDPIGGEFD